MTDKLTRRAMIGGIGGLAALAAGNAAAADWPSRTITIIHGFPAGGPSDVVARLIADSLQKSLGQPVIVEPKPGASGTSASAFVSRATPDGYTLMVIPSGFATAAATFAHLPYRSMGDFATITLASEYPYMMCTNVSSGIRTVAELLNAARTRPAPLLYGTPGLGSGPHLAIELFALKTKIKVQHVPFRGSAPAALELLAGRLDFMMDPPAALIPHVRSGKLNALAVSSAKHYFALPEVPTVAESGVPGFEVTGWYGLAAPAATPMPAIVKLNAEVNRALMAASFIEQLHVQGLEPVGGPPEEARSRLASEVVRWSRIIREAGIKAQ
jgi:tripartite-type tricarboxylate transporter receptor subunit TctC